MDLNLKHLAAGVVLAAGVGMAPMMIPKLLAPAAPAATVAVVDERSAREKAAIHTDGCFAAAKELRDFCATNPKMKDCPATATWLDVRCEERAKRD